MDTSFLRLPLPGNSQEVGISRLTGKAFQDRTSRAGGLMGLIKGTPTPYFHLPSLVIPTPLVHLPRKASLRGQDLDTLPERRKQY